MKPLKKDLKKDAGKKLAEAHWSYIEALLHANNVLPSKPDKFHYISAFVHGYKHGWEDK